MKNTIEFCFVLIFNNAFHPKLTRLEESSKRLVRTTPDNVRYEVFAKYHTVEVTFGKLART